MEDGVFIGRANSLWRIEVWRGFEITHIFEDRTQRKVKKAMRRVLGFDGVVHKVYGPIV